MNNELFLHTTKRATKMGLAKLTAILAGTLNIFLYVFAFISNLDSIKSSILFIVALLMSMYRFYRWAINSWQNKALKDLMIQEKELELNREKLKDEEKRVEILERELSIRITGIPKKEN